MAIVTGEIESLSRLKKELHAKGIYRFNSVKDIQNFQKNYIDERNAILDQVSKKIASELKKQEEEVEELRKTVEELNSQIQTENIAIQKSFQNLKNITKLFEIIGHKVFVLSLRTVCLGYTFRLRNKEKAFKNYSNGSELLFQSSSQKELKSIDFQYHTISSLKGTIAGALGEHRVVQELKKLPDDFYVINDFRLKFYKPLLHKPTNSKIYGIQIDHLVISGAGIFILETKNWSSQSIQNFDLRSPIDQIKRSNFALYLMLNSDQSKSILKPHHWGRRNIQTRNVLVLNRHKPKENFPFVAVRLISELPDYITYFESEFEPREVQNLFLNLKQMNGSIF